MTKTNIHTKIYLFLTITFTIIMLVCIVGCINTPTLPYQISTTPHSPLSSIKVIPASPDNLVVGATQQFAAVATYSDGSTAFVTSVAIWTSSDTDVATTQPSSDFSTEVATAVGDGTTSITASLSGVTSMPVNLTVIPNINPKTGVYKNYHLGLITPLGGDGCYDDKGYLIILINNKNAVNPSYIQLINFLQQDQADTYPYNSLIAEDPINHFYTLPAESNVDLQNIQNIIDGKTQPANPDVCADFAERLHNDAEMDGIRCAYVSLALSTGSHAIDAFQTTDRGLVYVDDTGWASEPHPNRAVKIADPIIGQQYITTALFPETGWEDSTQNMGTVTNVEIIWDGTWNN